MDIDWESLDWSKQDIVIANEVGRSRERVRQKRKSLGKPDSPHKHLHRGSFRERIQDVDTSFMTVREMAEMFDASRKTVRHTLWALGKSYRPDGEVNEFLGEIHSLYEQGCTDYAIAKKLGLSQSVVSTKLRSLDLLSNDVSHRVGQRGEQSALESLHARGFRAQLVSQEESFDISCEGARVEVKTSTLHPNGQLIWNLMSIVRSGVKRGGGYYEYERHYDETCDFVLLVWLREDAPDWYWVLPMQEIGDRDFVHIAPEPQRLHQTDNRKWLESRRDRFDLISDFLSNQVTRAA
jgi:predicted transcriptional regulator